MYDAREMTVEQIARVLAVGRTTLYRALRAQPANGGGGTPPMPGSGGGAVRGQRAARRAQADGEAPDAATAARVGR
jgi:hypothetical protein